MKGAYSFTICGDPLFFAPELVNHQGYDYAADLWALGVLAFEIYEESTPFGNSDTDETTIFKKISAYKGELPFTEKTPSEARALVQSWLNPTAHLRVGYLMDNAVRDNALFAGENECCVVRGGAFFSPPRIFPNFPRDLLVSVTSVLTN
jgi:cGMP-dependent protein kinase